tara:strand:- start:2530 stop:2964 length:435 start_codon:yes stop_codon:yes gene_type:complete
LLKDKKIIFILSFLAIVIIVSVLFLLNKTNNNQRISAKLITSVHKDLPLEFKTDKNLIILKPGEVKTINYYVRNLSEKRITGMATFQVYPPELKDYMTKMNCFCYEEQTFKVGEKEKYALVLLVDPNVTKNIKEAIIQFIFFKK